MTFIKQRKRTKTLKELCLAITFTIVLLSFLTTTSICPPPPLPLDIHGQVYIDGTKAFAGLNVSARISGVIVSSLLTNGTGYYGILSINSTYFGEVISLYVEDVFGQNTTFDAPGPRRIDLTITDTDPPSQPTGLTHTSPTTDNTPSFSWTASTDNLAVKGYYVNITGYPTNFTSATSWESPDVIADCNHTVNVWATDYANNNSTVASLNFTIDAAAPTVIIIAPTTASPTYTQTPTTVYVSYNYTEGHPKNATIMIHNATHTIGQTTITTLAAGTNVNRNDSVTIAAAADGAYNVTVTIYDVADHSSADEEADAVIIDSTPPVVSITYPTEGEYIDTVPIIWINGTVTEANMGTNQPMINDTAAFNLHHFNSATGEFAFYNITVIPDCTHSYRVNFTDLAGKTGYGTVTFTIDTVYPIVEITYPTDSHYFDSESVYWINGTFLEKNPNLTMPLVINHTGFILADWTWNSTTYEGTFAFCNGTVIEDCHYHVMVTLTDLAGKSASDVVYFYIDTTKPIVTITFPTDDYYFDSEAVIWINGTFTEKNFNITGLLDINHTGFILADWTWNSTTYEGTFAFKNTTALLDGTYHIKVSITDLAGKTGYDTVYFTVDTVAPVVDIAYPTEDQYLNTSAIWINGTVTELNKGSLEPHINNTAFSLVSWDPLTGTFAFKNNTAIPDGTICLKVSFTDLAGKTASDTVCFILDTTLPIVDITYPAEGAYLDSITVIWINGTVTELNRGALEPSINDTRFGNLAFWNGTHFAFKNSTYIAEGLQSVTVSFTDLAGNTGEATVEFTLDTTYPVVVITYPTEGAYLSVSTLWVNGTVVEENIGALEPSINDTRFSLTFWNGTHFAFKNTTYIPDCTHSVAVNFTDLAGKTGSDTVYFILDTTAPTEPTDLTWTSPTNDSTPSFSWTASTDNKAVKGYYVNIIGYPTYYIGNVTSWESPDTIPDCNHTINIWATDLANNNGTVASLDFTIDTTAPIVILIAPRTASPIYIQTPTTMYVSYNYTDLHPKNATIMIHNATHTIGQTTITTLASGTNVNRNDSVTIAAAADGAYNVTVTIFDTGGQSEGQSDYDAVIIDNTLPVVNITYPAEGEYLDGIAVIWINGTVTELNRGTLEPSINDTRLGDLDFWNGTHFGFRNNTFIADGLIALEISFTDLAGLAGTDTVTFTLDTTNPVVVITYPTEGAYINVSSSLWINGTVTELNKGTLEPHINDTRFTLAYWDSATGEFSFENNTAIPDGPISVEVDFTDLAGNTGSDSVTFTLDTLAPVLAITYPIDGAYLDDISIIWVNGTVTELNTNTLEPSINDTRFSLAYWDASTGTFGFQNVTYLPDCTYVVTVSFTDLAGNTGEDTVTFTLDTTAPIVAITYPTEGAYVTISPTIWVNGTVTELNKDALEPAINDTRFDLAHWDSATGAFAFLNNTRISEGKISVRVNFTDLAGKTGLDTVTFTLLLELRLEGVTAWYWVNDTTITSVVEGDVDADGLTEIVTGGYYYDGTREVAQLVVWNGSTLGLEGVTAWYWIGNTTITSVAIGDVDGDGGMEIVTAGCYHDGVRKVAQLAVWNGTTLSLENVTVWYWVGDTCINSVAIGDIDADGRTEIVTAGYYHNGTGNVAQLIVWDGQTLSLEGVTAWYWVGDTRINSVAIGDVDGDASTEIVTGGYYQSGVKTAQLATWDGTTLSLEKVVVWSWIGDTTINSVAIGDVDGDGLIEIVTGGSCHDGTYDSAQLVVWSGSDLTLEAVTGWRWIGDTTINSVALGDVDGDGDIELVTGGSYHDGTRTIAQLTVWAVTG